MRRKWKIGLVLAGAAVAFGAFWLSPSQEAAYEGKRLGQWLDEGMTLAPDDPYSTNQSVRRVVKAVQAIGTNAIPFLLRDMERKQSPWLETAQFRAWKLKLVEKPSFWAWRLNRSVWGFQALGTNGAPALKRLLALYDGDSLAVGSAQAALVALGPFALPELEKRLHATNSMKRRIAAGTLAYLGPAAEPAIPSLLAMLDDTNTDVRRMAVGALMKINRQPECLVPLFRGLLRDSNETIRTCAACGLGRFGLSAKAAIPDLVQTTNDPNPTVVSSARIALKQIESEASKAVSR
jgi:hypothetical protein